MIDSSITNNNVSDTSPSISIESASYFENNNMANETNHQEIESKDQEEYTPKLFSEEHDFEPDHDKDETNREAESSTDFEPDQLFEHDLNEEDDFEIPAFLRKQKF